ncbi:MAG: NAD(P)-dependent oxidoreductase [Lentisphaeria bacterium]|nr:NAD(P)-dependent oxidoreductase [Lentisphaeria bacterium]
MNILVTGSAGFICGYLVEELLKHGHTVYGIDNFSKYGKVEKSYDQHPAYHFVEGDVKNTALLKDLAMECDQMLCSAAMIGGISYFHEFAYDLLAENERIIASSFDAAIHAKKHGKLRKINVLSSSMVYESATSFPSREGDEHACPPPLSTYGFQKLACEYFAQGAWEQYQLPYTVIRPFNCVGTGEKRALCDRQIASGNIKLAMSHVVPDLVQKIVKGQDPLHILGSGGQIRHYTYGGDLARGIRLCIEKEEAVNQDFNLSTPVSTSVLELAEMIWKKIHGPDKPFHYVSDTPFMYDVQKRVPAVDKAEQLLGFRADTPLEDILDEVIPWIVEQIRIGGI